MEQTSGVRLHVEQGEDGQYLASSTDLPGLVAQGRTVKEALEIAVDVTRRLLDSYREHGIPFRADCACPGPTSRSRFRWGRRGQARGADVPRRQAAVDADAFLGVLER